MQQPIKWLWGIVFLLSASLWGSNVFAAVVAKDPPTPVGYNPQWLLITLVSLAIAGGVLLWKKMARR
ncbi:MAG: hypothetical protein ACLPN1_03335 [Dissulfurispiraceae bacterium]